MDSTEQLVQVADPLSSENTSVSAGQSSMAEIEMNSPADANFRPLYAWTVAVLAAAAYILSNVDRQLISILIAPIQRDLALTDTEFGTLQGLAYGLFYGVLCIPIAGLSDRYSRAVVISSGLALWSVATIACGLVSGFTELFVARAIVGMGEASLLPAVYSLVGDLFPRAKLGRAMGIFFLSPFLGSTLAFLLGGTAFHVLGENGHYSALGLHFHTWQLTFILAGLPGVLLAVIVGMIVHDKRAAERSGTNQTQAIKPNFREVFRFFMAQRAVFIPALVGFAFLAMPLYATFGWAPAYLIRTVGLTSAHAGIWLGSTSLIAGCSGALAAGFLMDLLVSRGRSTGPFDVGIFAAFVLTAGMAIDLVSNVPNSAMFVVASAICMASFAMAPSAAVIQIVAPPHFRSRISGMFLVINIIGQTFANFGIGALNDYVFGGSHGIKWSLPIFVGLSALGALIMLVSGRKALARVMSSQGR